MITSTANNRIKLVRRLQTLRREREEQRRFVIEGVRLVEEAFRAGCRPELVLYTSEVEAREQAILERWARCGVALESVTPAVMAAASSTQTPAGILAVVPFNEIAIPQPLTLAVVLDGVSEPGNAGAILRVADAANVQVVYLTPGTVDAYNPKVVRAAMGAHFHVPLREVDWPTLATQLAGLEVLLAETHGGEVYDEVDWRVPCALIIGSEAEGPSATARALAKRRVHIPMPGRAESLNVAVATGILLFAAVRQRQAGVAKLGADSV